MIGRLFFVGATKNCICTMKKGLLPILLSLLILPLACTAQFDEFGTIFGVSNYSGDLSERDVEPLECNLAYGIFARRNLNQRFAMKVQLSRLVLSGNDNNNSVESNLWRRNLSFRTELYEGAVQLEYSPLTLKSGENQFAPYAFLGLTAFHFNPQTELDGKVYNLARYQTEGVEYSLFQFSVPFGAGLRFNIHDKCSLGFELGWRKSFTDYLDDVSNTYRSDLQELAKANSLVARLSYRSTEGTRGDGPAYVPAGTGRGNPDSKDWYMLFGMTIGFKIQR